MIGATHTHRHTLQIKWLQQWSHIPMAILEMTTHMIICLNKNKTSNSIYMVLPCITMYYHHFLFWNIPIPGPKISISLEQGIHGARGRRKEARFPGPKDGMLRVSAE